MDNYVVFMLAVLLTSTLSAPPPSVTKVYRSDYEYNSQTDAFYKLHIEPRRGFNLKNVCEVEGASLMAPVSQLDIIQLHSMFKKFPNLGQYVYVALDGKDHESAEEPAIINLSVEDEDEHRGWWGSTCDVVTRNGEIETSPCYHEHPFICKVNAKDAPYDRHCDLFGTNYKYNSTIGGCYKIPSRVASWNEAYAECRAEGAHLVVLNSEAELLFVQSLIKETPPLDDAKTTWFFFAGFRANEPVGNETAVFKTIFNQTLAEAGCDMWSTGEPNNGDGGKEYCGTIFKNDGKLNDVNCDHKYAFICEKEVPTES